MIYSIMDRESFIISDGCHTENVLMIVLEGSFVLELDGRSEIANENSVIYFEKDKTFKRSILKPLKIIYIIFDHDCSISTGILKFADDARKIGTIKFLKEAIISNNRQMVRYFSSDLLAQFKFENRQSKAAFSFESRSFFDYVENNYNSRISIKDFSESVFMSHTGFLLKFKKEVGISPIEYIKNFRLDISAELLISSDLSVGEIATLCGYENLYYFSNAFKKQYGISPTKFRKNMI